jgi:hypothetical protein
MKNGKSKEKKEKNVEDGKIIIRGDVDGSYWINKGVSIGVRNRR